VFAPPTLRNFDGLGSVVALSNSSGTTIQTYEYTIYGEVAAEDPNHPNPYLFTGRRFDRETGLYYYRARYYNPYIGRFLQTDPVGYDDGINWYTYCRNNPLAYADPLGLTIWGLKISEDSSDPNNIHLVFTWIDLQVDSSLAGIPLAAIFNYDAYSFFIDCSEAEQGYIEDAFRSLWALPTGQDLVGETARMGITIKVSVGAEGGNSYDWETNTVTYDPTLQVLGDGSEDWMHRPAYIGLGHELIHAHHDTIGDSPPADRLSYAQEEARTIGVRLSIAYITGPVFPTVTVINYDYRDWWLTDNKLRAEAGVPLRPDIYERW